jgi:hypothetical protein
MSVLPVTVLLAWLVLLLQLLLVLRILRYLHAAEAMREGFRARRRAQPLAAGGRAPHFHARTLDGAPVELGDFAGRGVVFVFTSPHCPSCQRELRGLVRLGRIARQLGDEEVVVVSDETPEATAAWLSTVRERDGVTVDLAVVVAPPDVSDLLPKYNPGLVTPSYCHIDADGTVLSAAPLGDGGWPALRAKWERGGVRAGSPVRV